MEIKDVAALVAIPISLFSLLVSAMGWLKDRRERRQKYHKLFTGAFELGKYMSEYIQCLAVGEKCTRGKELLSSINTHMAILGLGTLGAVVPKGNNTAEFEGRGAILGPLKTFYGPFYEDAFNAGLYFGQLVMPVFDTVPGANLDERYGEAVKHVNYFASKIGVRGFPEKQPTKADLDALIVEFEAKVQQWHRKFWNKLLFFDGSAVWPGK
jgi:hypothetical protein